MAKILLIFQKFCKKQAARAWSPSVCVSQWGGGKEFMKKDFCKNFTRKFLSLSPPVWAKMGKIVKT